MSLDPQVQGLLDAFKAQGLKSFEQMTVPEARATAMAFVDLEGDVEPVAEVTEHRVPVRGGEIALRLYRPAGAAAQPVVVYFHGGGFVFGNLDLVDKVARSLSKVSGAAVASVDYRKAPEHPFPTAPEDAYAALGWVREHAGQFGLDAARIAVAGDSAGGNLAAVVSQIARDRQGPKIVHQVLIYPVTDAAGVGYPSRQENAEGYLLTQAAMEWFFGHYLTDPAEAKLPYVSPIRGDLQGLPAATVITAGYDPLRDEGRAYANRLIDAGVKTTYVNYPGTIHGFFSLTRFLQQGLKANDEAAAVMGAFFGT